MRALRLLFDASAAVLFVAALAYWWLGNLAHEAFGLAVFALLAAHNVFNRRWYGRVARLVRRPRGAATVALNLALLAAMLVLAVTSVLISRSLLGELVPGGGFGGGLGAVEAHILAAYWAIVLAGAHVGLNWPIVVGWAATALGAWVARPPAAVAAWLVAFAIAAEGLDAFAAHGIGDKLIGRPALVMWDFGAATPAFFADHLAVLALFATAARLAVVIGSRLSRRRSAAATSPPPADRPV